MKIVQEQLLQLLMGGIFPDGREWKNFQLVGGFPTIPSVGKTMHAAI